MGDDLSEPATALPWLWVIEALAGIREISTCTLQGLIDAAPVVPDEFCENTRELVALRCLEELSGSVHGVNPAVSSSVDARVGFDFSRSCEDVLQEILHEVPLSNLKMASAELLKWDVYPFIMHKRASTIKCHLEQLKESILEGTHPHTDYLKERSGLSDQNRGYTVHVSDAECNDHSEKDNVNSTYAEKMGAKENLVSLILVNENKSSKEHLLDNNFLPSKRNMVYSDDEHFMGYPNEKQVCINECEDFLRNSKRIKCYASTNLKSNKENPVSQLGKGVSENSTERILPISEKGGLLTEKDNRETLGHGSLEDSHNRCTASNWCRASSHNEVFHDESNIPFNATVMPQHTSGSENCQQQLVESIPTNVALPDGIQHKISGSEPRSTHETDLKLKDTNDSRQTVAGDKAQDDASNGCEVDISGDRIVYQGDKNNLFVEKHEEQNLGMKCNEGCHLLVCDATTFPLVVPESCLGTTTTMMPQHTSGDDPCQNTPLNETNDTEHYLEPIPTNDDDADKIQPMINESQSEQKEPNAACLNISQKPVASDKTVVDTVNGCGEELSSDSDGYHKEKIDLAARKHDFLSSQCTFGQDFSAISESSEQNLCMKCNEGGQLLVCKTTTCPLMVHKNCLGASAQLDAKGNFFCPFCEYSRAISEYLEAKKKASLARKELAIFINKGIRNQATELVHEFHRQERSLSRKSSQRENIHVKNNGNDQLTGCEDDREDLVGEHANELNNLQFERSQQQAPVSRVRASCREKENVNNGLVEVLREEERDEMLNSNNLAGGRVVENEVPTDHVDGDGGDKFSCKIANMVSANQGNAGEEIPQEMMKQHDMDGTVEPVCAYDTGKEDISEDECEKHIISRYSMRSRKHETQYPQHAMDGTLEPVCAYDAGKEDISEDECEKHIISRYSMRSRKHETQYKPQASPQLRRKKIPWTTEEEELIREGVQKFGYSDPKIPWKKILAFGSHVFERDDKHRTPQDLKDKWKNMCKAHSKLK